MLTTQSASPIRNLLRRIHRRGHEIGPIPAITHFAMAAKARSSIPEARLREEDINQVWEANALIGAVTPTTMRAWADAGMSYDSSLGYADRPGFRCGTCFEYPMFDAERQEQVNLKIRPLIAMECSIIDDTYMGLGLSCKSTDAFKNLKKSCKLVEGKFTLLWHNSYFKQISDLIDSIDPKEFFSEIIKY